jgi:hypothetical protein
VMDDGILLALSALGLGLFCMGVILGYWLGKDSFAPVRDYRGRFAKRG